MVEVDYAPTYLEQEPMNFINYEQYINDALKPLLNKNSMKRSETITLTP